MVALENLTSSIVAVQLLLGQPACFAVSGAGEAVVTLKLTFPFLILFAGIDVDPTVATRGLFWPGAWLPPGLVQVILSAVPTALSVIVTSSLPRPAREPLAVRVTPLSVKVGPDFQWTLAASAAGAIATTI